MSRDWLGIITSMRYHVDLILASDRDASQPLSGNREPNQCHRGA